MGRNITRRFLTSEQTQQYNLFIEEINPSDKQQIHYLQNQFPNLLLAQIFQLFEILNSRRHQQQINFENLIRRVRIRNNHIVWIQRNRRNNAANPQVDIPPPNTENTGGNQGAQTPSVLQPFPVAMVQSPLVFVDDPFKGNINPGTSDGAKLYMKATAVTDEEDKFDINIDNAHTFLKHMTRDTNNFGWGVLVRTVETSPAVFKNII